MTDPQSKSAHARATLQRLIASWDVAAWLLVLFDSAEAFADEDTASDFFDALAETIAALDPDIGDSSGSAEGLEYLRDWRAVQTQTSFSFTTA